MKPNSRSLAAIALLFVVLFENCQKDFETTVNTGIEKTDAVAGIKPNIIFIVGDDIGYEIPAIDGGKSYPTPNIDKLAQSGMRFTQCRSAALCSPSRFMLLTGKYNFRNYGIWGIMDTSQRTIGNMLKDAGYATCYGGKWQLDGGDKSIRKFGFDKYSIWLPFKICPEESEGSRYKSAKIYQDGGYLPQEFTNNKYSEDMISDYLLNFMDSNKTRPFFIYYSMILCHKAFSPTPDNPEYASWVADPAISDTVYYPSMVKYMDKKIGMVIDKVKSLGLDNNTVILYIGDNGTPKNITSLFKNKSITGAKGFTVEYGIHVPLICKWPGKITGGAINGNLIDFTDFLPTLAGIANIPLPRYGILDGTSFYPQLKGRTGTPRSSIFTHFNPLNCGSEDNLIRYAQDSSYKLYGTGEFYRFVKDVNEENPLADSTLTNKQKQIKQNLQNVLNSMHN
jgi:arylsulfatase A